MPLQPTPYYDEDGNEYKLRRIDPNNAEDSKAFDQIYDLYTKCFPLDTEQVSKDEFLRILKAGDKYNKEMWISLENKDGKVIGAENFDVLVFGRRNDLDPKYNTEGLDGTVHGIFAFVDPEYRNKGLSKVLVSETNEAARDFVTDTLVKNRDKTARDFIRASGADLYNSEQPNIITIGEQNSPLLMTPAEILQDPMDPIARRSLFGRRGMQQIGIRYIQPSVGNSKEACTFLDLCVSGIEGDSISKDVLMAHLDRWFKLSFPEGTTLEDAGVRPMMDALKAAPDQIPLLSNDRYEQLYNSLAAKSLEGMKAANIDSINGVSLESVDKDKLVREYMTMLAQDEKTKDIPLGSIFPELAIAFYGKENIGQYKDILPTVGASEQDIKLDKDVIRAESVFIPQIGGKDRNSRAFAHSIVSKMGAANITDIGLDPNAMYGNITSSSKQSITNNAHAHHEATANRQDALAAAAAVLSQNQNRS